MKQSIKNDSARGVLKTSSWLIALLLVGFGLCQTQISEAFNTAAFTVPATGTYGNAGTSPLYSMHVANTDMSLFKNFPIGEQFSINLRAEVFNVFNIQNYGPPDTNVILQDLNSGVITSNVTNPRQIQLGAHVNF